MKRKIRFFSKDMGAARWTRWFDLNEDDPVPQSIRHMEIERVEVIEEMTRQDFETQFMCDLSQS